MATLAFVLRQELWENNAVKENEARGEKCLTVSGRWKPENERAAALQHPEVETAAISTVEDAYDSVLVHD